MKEEEQNLLIKDLSCRLPYGVKIDGEDWYHEDLGNGITTLTHSMLADFMKIKYWPRPYLRPMCSVSEEEREYLRKLQKCKCTIGGAEQMVDFCVSRHLDYRGLIEKGLALEAPEGMYTELGEIPVVDNEMDLLSKHVVRNERSPKVQFEFKTVFSKHFIKEAYEWCVANLPLKEDRGLVYQVDEMYIITSSQKVIDKVNAHFGSKFSFENVWENRIWFLEDKK